MSNITLHLDNLTQSPAPLYHEYAGQLQPQRAYVEMDEDGEVRADWSAHIGGGCSPEVWHDRTLQWRVPSNVNGPFLAQWLSTDGRELLQAVHDGHSIEWDGSNHVGRLTDDAQRASEKLAEALEWFETVDIWGISEYLFENNRLTDLWSGCPLPEAVTRIEQEILSSDLVVLGDVERALLHVAESEFDQHGDDTLDEHHVAALLANRMITADQAQAWREAKQEQQQQEEQ